MVPNSPAEIKQPEYSRPQIGSFQSKNWIKTLITSDYDKARELFIDRMKHKDFLSKKGNDQLTKHLMPILNS